MVGFLDVAVAAGVDNSTFSSVKKDSNESPERPAPRDRREAIGPGPAVLFAI